MYVHQLNSNRRAFSLIELMIVITIIGILAAVAVPSYQDYVLRARMVDVVNVFGHYKKNLEEYYMVNGKLPAAAQNSLLNMGTNGDCGTNQSCTVGALAPNPYVVSVWIGGRTAVSDQDLVLLIKTDAAMGAAQGKRLIFRATIASGGGLTWQCMNHHSDSPPLELKYLPANCINEPT